MKRGRRIARQKVGYIFRLQARVCFSVCLSSSPFNVLRARLVKFYAFFRHSQNENYLVPPTATATRLRDSPGIAFHPRCIRKIKTQLTNCSQLELVSRAQIQQSIYICDGGVRVPGCLGGRFKGLLFVLTFPCKSRPCCVFAFCLVFMTLLARFGCHCCCCHFSFYVYVSC